LRYNYAVLAARTTRRLILVAAIASVGAAVLPSFAYGDFKQPGGGVYCTVGRTVPASLQCWRSKSGLTLAMGERGRPSFQTLRRNRNTLADSSPPLRFGRSWTYRGFKCSMARNGLTCKNRSRHGWFMGRTEGYRLL
jgi:hypothetical protein